MSLFRPSSQLTLGHTLTTAGSNSNHHQGMANGQVAVLQCWQMHNHILTPHNGKWLVDGQMLWQ